MVAPLASDEEDISDGDYSQSERYSATDMSQYFTDDGSLSSNSNISKTLLGDLSDDSISDGLNISNALLKETRRVLPPSVLNRSKALLEYLKDKGEGKISWSKKGKLMVNGRVVPGSNIIDLTSHVVRERGSAPRKVQSPGAPAGFTTFSKILRELNVPKELVRNQRRWGRIYTPSTPSPTPTGASKAAASRWLRM